MKDYKDIDERLKEYATPNDEGFFTVVMTGVACLIATGATLYAFYLYGVTPQ